MVITYTEEKNFTPQQVADLFLSVRWVVGKYPDRLHRALMNSSRVISAWDGNRLVGLIRVMDDSELVCFINYVLVHPEYHGRGIACSFARNGERRLQVLFVYQCYDW